jgi:apolipoprotein N-acyltransferase
VKAGGGALLISAERRSRRVVARIDLDTVGYADLPLPAADASAPTLYARSGDWILLALLCLGLLPVALRLR